MADIERHEEEGARAFDPRLARRLLKYLRPYRLRATLSVLEKDVAAATALREPMAIAALELEGAIAARGGDSKKGYALFRQAADREAAILVACVVVIAWVLVSISSILIMQQRRRLAA